MTIHTVGFITSAYPSFDHAPTANNDTAQVAYNGSLTIAALANDTDPDTATLDQNYLGIGRYTDPVLSNGQAAGALQCIGNQFVFTASDPNFATGPTAVTFSYTAVDQWGAESGWATVTVTVTGNATPGVTYYGLNSPNVIYDSAGNDLLYGGNNKDKIYSSTGADHLFGQNGKDFLVAGNGNDSLVGGNGNDTLVAGSGADFLTGGRGHDMFVLGANFTKATITDFDPKTDSISISPWVLQSFGDLQTHAQPHGADLWVSTADLFDPSLIHTLILQNISLSQLHADNFFF
jgi:Ca2+-binding RTX toxin-like protein